MVTSHSQEHAQVLGLSHQTRDRGWVVCRLLTHRSTI